MSDSHTLKEEIALLKKRNAYLEEAHRWQAFSLDLAVSTMRIPSAHDDFTMALTAIFSTLRNALTRLLKFQVVAFFLLDEEGLDFEYSDCNPVEKKAFVNTLVDNMIDSGAFAWALRQNCTVVEQIPDLPGKHILMHTFIIGGKEQGMFIGILGADKNGVSDRVKRSHQELLSILINNGAHALEGAFLQKALYESNQKLEHALTHITENNMELHEQVNAHATSETALREAMKQAEEASQAKSAFLANMSHEIRTPMNGVMGMVDLALATQLPEKSREYLTQAKSSSQTLLRLINDILDFSKIEAGKLSIDPIPFYLGDVMSEAVAFFRSKGAQEGVEIIVSAPPTSVGQLIGDPFRIQQVIINLLGNAIKFTHEGEIALRVRPIEQSSSQIVLQFSVTDTGIGLSEEQIARLFSAFVQADGSTTRKYGGTGLGLAICKRLVDMMGGRIWVESQLEQGSTFFFTVTLGLERNDHPHALSASDDIYLNALVVEDHPGAREVMIELLDTLNISCHAVAGGGEALACFSQPDDGLGPFDVVFIDWPLADIDGVTLIEMMRDRMGQLTTEESDWSARFVAMTAQSEEVTMRQARTARIDAFLAKPMTPSSLMSAVLEAFGKNLPSIDSAGPDKTLQKDLIQHVAGARVLLVEDNLINQKVAQEILQNLGIEVSIANHGQEALEIMAVSDPYDLLLMDVQMPVMDGYQATRAIRADELFQDIPIVAMTAHALIGDRQRCLSSGMDDYVTKPIDLDQLYSALMKWIKAEERGVDLQAFHEAQSAQDDVLSDVLPDHLPGLDGASALRRLGGNIPLLKEMWREFHRDYVDFISPLRTMLLEQHDLEEGRRQLHALKGVAGNLGARGLHQVAKDFEMALKETRNDLWPNLLDPLQEALHQVMQSIASLGPEDAPQDKQNDKPAGPLDLEALKPVVNKLLNLIREGNIDASDEAANVVQLLRGTPHHRPAKKVAEAVEMFDFEVAATHLQSLAEALSIEL
ncbi:MAG: response regulator [Magnetococcales bacterium]|nr:response regulator [Magnetococcales bacterium]